MNPVRRVYDLLRESGAKLKRRTGHEVWELPNGKNFVRATTPSDARGDLNNLSDLKHALGIVGETKEEQPRRERREKHPPKRQPVIQPVPQNSVFAEKLKVAGVVEDQLRAKIAELESSIEKYSISVTRMHSTMENGGPHLKEDAGKRRDLQTNRDRQVTIRLADGRTTPGLFGGWRKLVPAQMPVSVVKAGRIAAGSLPVRSQTPPASTERRRLSYLWGRFLQSREPSTAAAFERWLVAVNSDSRIGWHCSEMPDGAIQNRHSYHNDERRLAFRRGLRSHEPDWWRANMHKIGVRESPTQCSTVCEGRSCFARSAGNRDPGICTHKLCQIALLESCHQAVAPNI